MAEIQYDDFPALMRAADSNSLKGQRRYLWVTRIQLGSLVAAAGFGMLSLQGERANLVASLAAVAFAAALISEIYRLKERPDRMWYAGRAVAESAKTLTWRYMVGGAPLAIKDMDSDRATELLLQRFTEIEHDVEPIWLVPAQGAPDQVSAAMRQVRELPLAERRELYLRERIDDQRSWYAVKSRWNARRSTLWSVCLAAVELAGLTAGILRAAGMVDVDLLGFAAALAAAGAAWMQAKQHQSLATAYAVASHELAAIRARMGQQTREEEWAMFVSDAEEAVSREHTLWRASHGAS
ncbi:uncharacterized protein DUF4231 [Murinocardiopsis flavida]|uniref:Uncharacterized protein DUF4231 n=1 Tax=Murinocardiopsis flavida TaxID=645275 RepID=A0A2P8CRA7_9ACTN|nr:DUF4231 domain-containing protein [Murinocardiopsis flavida]PSK87503.1 uncharacterized protein DUF4231 [Murinocardiopsis flavida]